MKQIITIVILATAGYFIYANWNQITSTITTKVQNEKTIQAVTQGRQTANIDTTEALKTNQ